MMYLIVYKKFIFQDIKDKGPALTLNDMRIALNKYRARWDHIKFGKTPPWISPQC